MAECVVIADEITGGSAVGALLEKNNCSVCSIMSAKGLKDPQTANFDCFVYSTNSRNLTQEQSYQLVFYAGRLLKNPQVKVYAKRIDPSLRGNACSETQALLDALGDNDRVAIVVPAFPALKRSTVGGYILVDGKPLQKSLVGMDEITQQASGRVADLFTEKFRYHAEALHLKEFLHGTGYLAERIADLASRGARAIVFDATSQEEINMIADAVLQSGIKYLAVDPGPFTATIARKVMRDRQNNEEHKPRIFGMIGGSNPLISAQVEQLRLEEKVLLVSVRNKDLLDGDQKRMAEIDRVVNEIATRFSDYTVAFAVSDHLGANTQQISEFDSFLLNTNRTRVEALDLISTAYGEIASGVLQKRNDIKAVYTTGAEYTVAVCRELKSLGLKIKGQVLPLTAYAEILGGNYNGLKYVTTASSATDTNTLVDAIQYLKRKLEI